MQTDTDRSWQQSRWAFSLFWINLAVGVVCLVQFLSNQFANTGDLLRSVAYSVVYANLTGIIGIVVLGWVAGRLANSRLPLIPIVAAGMLVLTAAGCLLAQTLLMLMGVVVPDHFWREYFYTLRVAMPLAAVFGLGALVHASLRDRAQTAERKLHEKEVAEERARKLATEARLRSLESRIHPHFLFNTLNTISALLAVDPAQAERIVGRLATLLRASLDNSNQPLIPLRQELAMVESYLEIERVRFGDKLRRSVDVPADLLETPVPPLSIQALVDNAVKHGIALKGGNGEIAVTAIRADGSARIEVRDSGPGFDLKAIPAGHGLDNLVERLDALFGSQAKLVVSRRDEHCIVEMVVPRV